MPIRESEKARYPKDWPAISKRIRERENQRCKWCGAPNGKMVSRFDGTQMWTTDIPEILDPVPWEDLRQDIAASATWWGEDGQVIGLHPKPHQIGKPVRVVLTVAHLDHTPENCADDNLAALCQRCHNRYDLPMRREGRKARLGIIGLDFPAPKGGA